MTGWKFCLRGANSKVTVILVSFSSILLIWAYSEAYPDFDQRACSIYTDCGNLKLQGKETLKEGSEQPVTATSRSSEVVQGENHSAALLWHGGREACTTDIDVLSSLSVPKESCPAIH
jgi:hypothetical protein